jgi:hypothetical protein
LLKNGSSWLKFSTLLIYCFKSKLWLLFICSNTEELALDPPKRSEMSDYGFSDN